MKENDIRKIRDIIRELVKVAKYIITHRFAQSRKFGGRVFHYKT